jgi:TetR/AcrR family transcriptional repressor of nem operon
MARPREFDEDQVLDAVVATFWSRGFDATSIQDIVEVTGLSRASLYGAFGDKERLFERAMARYAARLESVAAEASADPSPLRALERLLNSWLSVVCSKDKPRGCFLVAAGTEKDDDSFARATLREEQKKMELLLTKLIERARKQGEITKSADPPALARLLVVMQQGLASAARAGWSRERLDTVVAQALALVRA